MGTSLNAYAPLSVGLTEGSRTAAWRLVSQPCRPCQQLLSLTKSGFSDCALLHAQGVRKVRKQQRTAVVAASLELAVAVVAAVPICWICYRHLRTPVSSSQRPELVSGVSHANLKLEAPESAESITAVQASAAVAAEQKQQWTRDGGLGLPAVNAEGWANVPSLAGVWSDNNVSEASVLDANYGDRPGRAGQSTATLERDVNSWTTEVYKQPAHFKETLDHRDNGANSGNGAASSSSAESQLAIAADTNMVKEPESLNGAERVVIEGERSHAAHQPSNRQQLESPSDHLRDSSSAEQTNGATFGAELQEGAREAHEDESGEHSSSSITGAILSDVNTGAQVDAEVLEDRGPELKATFSGRSAEVLEKGGSDRASGLSTRKAYVDAYKELLHTGRLPEAVTFLEKGHQEGKLKAKKISHQHLLYACKERKDVRTAVRLLKLLEKPSLSTYNMVMGVCAEAGDVDRAFALLAAAQKSGLQADCQMYTTLITACTTGRRLDLAFKVLRDMEAAKVEPNIMTYGAVIHGCGQARQVAKAFGIYSIILKKGLKPDRAIYNSLISACGKSGALQRAFDVRLDMKQDGLVANSITVGALIDACARAGELDPALEIYKGLKGEEEQPSREVYTSLVHACSKSGNLVKALEIYEDMKKANMDIDEVLFSALMDVAQHAGEVDTAFGLLEEMERVGVPIGSITYTALVGVCSNAGLTERARGVYEDLKAAGVTPTVSLFNALISAYGKEGNLREALGLLGEMKDAGVAPDKITIGTLLAACEKVNEADKAFGIYEMARAEGLEPFRTACVVLVGICFHRVKTGGAPPLPTYSAGAAAWEVVTQPSQQQWAFRALRVYRETIAAGVKVPLSTLSALLGCLKLRRTRGDPSGWGGRVVVKSDNERGDEYHLAHVPIVARGGVVARGGGVARPAPAAAVKDDGAGMYAPQAMVLYEEAAAAGIVPQFTFTGPMDLNLTNLPPNAAEVCILAMLKGLRQRRATAPESRVFPVKLTLKTHLKSALEDGSSRPIHICSRSGAAVAALLRRLRIHYVGQESSGAITLPPADLAKWLQPRPPSKPARAKSAPPQGGAFLPNRLAKGIAEQQMAIRMAQEDGSDLGVYRDGGEGRRSRWNGSSRKEVRRWERREGRED